MKKKNTMNKRFFWINLVLLSALLLASCSSGARVGALREETQTVELDDVEVVSVEIDLGVGNLDLAGGADKLLDANFAYNVDKLKPEVEYSDGRLTIRQPNIEGLSDLRNISDFRNEWDLRLNDSVPIDLEVNLGPGTSDLRLAGLPLTQLSIMLVAGDSTFDLRGDWARDLDIAIETGMSNVHARLPGNVGVRVVMDAGVSRIETSGLTQDGNTYTNAAYGKSDVTLAVNMESVIGRINLEVEEASATPGGYDQVAQQAAQPQELMIGQ